MKIKNKPLLDVQEEVKLSVFGDTQSISFVKDKNEKDIFGDSVLEYSNVEESSKPRSEYRVYNTKIGDKYYSIIYKPINNISNDSNGTLKNILSNKVAFIYSNKTPNIDVENILNSLDALGVEYKDAKRINIEEINSALESTNIDYQNYFASGNTYYDKQSNIGIADYTRLLDSAISVLGIGTDKWYFQNDVILNDNNNTISANSVNIGQDITKMDSYMHDTTSVILSKVSDSTKVENINKNIRGVYSSRNLGENLKFSYGSKSAIYFYYDKQKDIKATYENGYIPNEESESSLNFEVAEFTHQEENNEDISNI